MVRVEKLKLTREVLFVSVKKVKKSKKPGKDLEWEKAVLIQVEADHPELKEATVVRNGVVYPALEYLAKDLESYAPDEAQE